MQQALFVSFRVKKLSSYLQEQLLALKPTGICLFAYNYDSHAQFRSLCKDLKELLPGLVLAIDCEGGRVVRFPLRSATIPPASVQTTWDKKTIQNLWEKVGAELFSLGIDLNFAPVCDLKGPLFLERSYNGNIDALLAVFHGLKNAGIKACAKHFPGLGHGDIDTHDAPLTLHLDERELLTFQALIDEGIEYIMLSHARYRELQDTNLAAFLRSLGFRGTVVSDDLSMGAVGGIPFTQAIAKARKDGIDAPLFCFHKPTLFCGLRPPRPLELGDCHFPCIAIEPIDPGPIFQQITACKELILTSKTAVQRVMELTDSSKLAHMRFFCIGKATAQTLEHFGFSSERLPQDETAEGLIALLAHAGLQKPFYPHSALSRPVLGNFLNAFGVIDCITYTTCSFEGDKKPALDNFETIFLSSPSCVDGFLAAFGCIPKGKTVRFQGPITESYFHVTCHS